MIEAIITSLIYICLLGLAIYLIIWVVQTIIGIALPEKVVQIIWVVFVLIVVLLLVRILVPSLGVKLTALLPFFA